MSSDARDIERPVADIDPRTQLSLRRTALAYDRTLMAWTRTATSLISFGFSIYKFFDLTGVRPVSVSGQRLIGPHVYALAMIFTGLVALAFANFDHRANMKALVASGGIETPARARWVAGAVAALGVLAMAAVIFNE